MTIFAKLSGWLRTRNQPLNTKMLSNAQIKQIAYHEAGHAIASCACGRGGLIKSVSITPKTKYGLGLVRNTEDPNFMSVATRTEFEQWIVVKLAGRAAEETVFGKANVSVGSWHDIEVATNLALKMIGEFGFSDLIGLVYLPRAEQYPEVRLEVARTLNELYQRALAITSENLGALDRVAENLIEQREIKGDDVRWVYANSLSSVP